jgi:hypothetical protein
MFDNKFLITLIAGLLVSVIAVTNTIKNNEDEEDVVENFGMLPSFGVKSDLISTGGNAPNYSNNMNPQQSMNSIGNNMNRALANTPSKGDFYSVPGTYQALLAPRTASINYGADIKYNMPSIDNQAVPPNPLTFSNMVKEGYCTQNSQTPPFHSGILTDSGYANGNYNDVLKNVYNNVPKVSSDIQVNLPVRDMTSIGIEGDDNGVEITQPVIYDRFMVANRNSC